MNSKSIGNYFEANSKFFKEEQISILRNAMTDAPDSKYDIVRTTKLRSPAAMTAIAIFFPGFEKFFLGETGKGLLKLFTLGGFGIWAVIDWFKTSGHTKSYNYNKVAHIL